MKLENKLGIYAMIAIFLTLAGFAVMLYPFEYYSELDKMTDNTDMTILLAVFGTKAIGVAMLYLASEIYHKHFKCKSYESN
jgi:hypothetical protein